jgi:hypothetical protein
VWEFVTTDKFERCIKLYEKKRPNELKAVLLNLDKYFVALNQVSSRQIRAGYIHVEPLGIIAIDQKGFKKDGTKRVKLQETRLYLYPDLNEKTVYLLLIGSKNTQKQDIKTCCEYVKTHKDEK